MALGFLVIVGISVAIAAAFILNTPESPKFHVVSVNTTTPFNVTNPETTVNGGLNITFLVTNPHAGAIYGNSATVQVYHRNLLLSSSAPFNSLCPGKPYSCMTEAQSVLPVPINISSTPVSDPVSAAAIMSDMRRQELSLNFELIAEYRWSEKPDKAAKLTVKCNDVKIGVPTGDMMGVPRNCKVYWSSSLRRNKYWFLIVGGCIVGFILLGMLCVCCLGLDED